MFSKNHRYPTVTHTYRLTHKIVRIPGLPVAGSLTQVRIVTSGQSAQKVGSRISQASEPPPQCLEILLLKRLN